MKQSKTAWLSMCLSANNGAITSSTGGKVWKYPLQGMDDGHCWARVPEGARFLHYGMQGGQHTVWFVVDPGAREIERWFTLTGTGFDAPPDAIHRGTVFDGPFVWHLFEEHLVEVV